AAGCISNDLVLCLCLLEGRSAKSSPSFASLVELCANLRKYFVKPTSAVPIRLFQLRSKRRQHTGGPRMRSLPCGFGFNALFNRIEQLEARILARNIQKIL